MLRLCDLNELTIGQARRLQAGRHLLLLIRTSTRSVHAYLNRCPHLGIPLAWQDSQLMSQDGEYLQCSTHGALFETRTGFCISGPCQGDQLWAFTCQIDGTEVKIDETELPQLPSLN